MIVFVKKYWERIMLLFVTGAFFFLVALGIYFQKKNKQELKFHVKMPVENSEMQVDQAGGSELTDIASPGPNSFYLRPLPEELMEQIANLESVDEKVATAKFAGLPVMWSAYFFSLQKGEGNLTTVQLDVSENGFGIALICDVDVDSYPDITGIERGKKMWVAGEILAVDPSGTGTIYLKTDYFRFTEQGDAAAAVAPAEQ